MQKKNLEKFVMILTVAVAALVLALHAIAQAGSCGVDWQTANPVPEEILIVNCVTYGNGQFVATAGFPGGFLTSPDGLNWSWHTLFSTQIYNGVTWGGNQYVAVKRQDYSSPAIRTSPDGVTWTGHNPGILGGLDLHGVTWNGSQYVAVGGEDAISLIANSPDGVDWTHATGQDGELRSVTWNGNQFVAVGESPYISGYQIRAPILTSSDGVAWIAQDSGTTQDLNDVTWGGNQFVAVGDGSLGGTEIKAIILTSPDGVTWTRQDSSTTNDLKSVTYGANQFVAVGADDTILTSPDGATWTAQGSGTNKYLFSVTWGEDRFVAVGTTILVSTCGTQPELCKGDFNGDGDVDGSDLAVFATDFGRTDCAVDYEGDFDDDGDIDGSDLAVFAADFGRTDCPH